MPPAKAIIENKLKSLESQARRHLRVGCVVGPYDFRLKKSVGEKVLGHAERKRLSCDSLSKSYKS